MKYERGYVGMYDGMIWIFVFCIALLVAGIGGAIYSGKKKSDFLKGNSCQLLSKEETGNRKYCGKACTRAEIKEIYSCSFGEHVIIN